MAYEYQYGDDDQIDYYIRRIERVRPGFYNNFINDYGTRKKPSDAEITNTYYEMSADGAFYLINDEEEEREISRSRRNQYYESDSSDIGVGGALGGLASLLFTGLAAGAAYLYNKISEEDEYYYDDEDEDY